MELGHKLILFGVISLITSLVFAPSYELFALSPPIILPMFNEPNSNFGTSISISGNLVLIGVPRDIINGASTGSAYLYDSNTGILLKAFINPTPDSEDRFGNSVSISGNFVLIGAPNDDTGATNAGSAYLFDTTGTLLQTFNNPTPSLGDLFGSSVSISGSNILIGASGNDTFGSAYLFDTTGTLLQTFNNPTPSLNDLFGTSVSISGSNILIGASFDDTGALDAGSAYLFDTTGTLLQTFNNPSPSTSDRFGESVSISGSNILIGASGNTVGIVVSGSAYLFDTTGTLLQTFNNPTPANFDNFGRFVAIFNNLVLIGASGDDTGATNAGSAYLFDTTGTLLQTFNNPTPASTDQFGTSVAISGNNILIGAPMDDTGSLNIGSVYLYDSVTGSYVRDFDNLSQGASDNFGRSVAVSNNFVLVGSPFRDTGAPDAGSAYLFDTAGTLLQTFNNPTPASTDQFGTSVAISGNFVLIGAPGDDSPSPDAGSAYLFDTAGTLLQTFNNPPTDSVDQFGFSVALSGNNVLIGARYGDVGSTDDAGSAYLFDTAGTLLQTFTSPAPYTFGFFGTSVSVSGNKILIGASGDPGSISGDFGSAYLFDTTGTLLQTFTGSQLRNEFGTSVSVSGNKILIGAPFHDTGNPSFGPVSSDAGAAYLFDTTGTLLQTLDNPAPDTSDLFGFSVAISGNDMLVGANNNRVGSIAAGSAYLFDATAGTLLQTLDNPAPSTGDGFGTSVSVSGNKILIGALNDDAGATNAGSAYLYVDDQVTLYCNNMTIDDLISSGLYNVIDYRSDTFGTKIRGTSGADLILLSDTGNHVQGKEGNDCIIGGIMRDVISGGLGDDQVYGGLGDDHITGRLGLDMIFGEAGNDRLSGGAGNDSIFGGDDDDVVLGREDDDALSGGEGNDYCGGESGVDTADASCEISIP